MLREVYIYIYMYVFFRVQCYLIIYYIFLLLNKDEKFAELKQKFSDIQTKLIKSKQDMITIKGNNDRIEAEKRDLMSVIDKKSKEIENLNGIVFLLKYI